MKEERNRVYIRSCKMVLWPIRARVLFELFYNFCCFLFPLGVLVNGIREANQGTHLLSHQFRQSGHLT